jgi:hypothetical protein
MSLKVLREAISVAVMRLWRWITWIAYNLRETFKKWRPIQALSRFFRTLDLLKSVACLCLVFALFVAIPNQTLEMYRYIAQSLATAHGSGNFIQSEGAADSVIIILSTCLLSIVLLAVASFQYSLHSRDAGNADSDRFSTTPFALIASIPLLSVSIGLLRATIDTQSSQLRNAVLTGLRLSFIGVRSKL